MAVRFDNYLTIHCHQCLDSYTIVCKVESKGQLPVLLSLGILRSVMYLLLWIAVVGLLRFLPLCTASPVTASSNSNGKPTKQSITDACSNPSSAGMTPSCWTLLKMNDYFSSWTNQTILPNAPMIGTIYCRPNEVWAQCFIRFAYGQQRQTRAPMDCATLGSSNCKAPSDMLIKPTSPEYWYGAYAIYGTLINAFPN